MNKATMYQRLEKLFKLLLLLFSVHFKILQSNNIQNLKARSVSNLFLICTSVISYFSTLVCWKTSVQKKLIET